MKSAMIIGFGRFGQLMADVLKSDFDFTVASHNERTSNAANRSSLPEATISSAGEYDFIFIAMPISKFEKTVQQIQPFVGDKQVVVDVCSVKVFPARIMQKYLTKCQVIATHPLFGPDSAKLGLRGLKVAFAPMNVDVDNANYLRVAWEKHGINVIDTTPEEHDKDSVYSQAFTYSIARIILNMDLHELKFDTRSYQAITRVAKLSANDTDQLFHDMMHYNPYFPEMLKQLKVSWVDSLQTLDLINKEPKPSVFETELAVD